MRHEEQPALRALRVALVAGEASGDLLGAGLMDALRARCPQVEFAGVGGPAMRDAGLDAWRDSAELAVMGLAEIIVHLPRLLALRRDVRARLLAWHPDVFIGIDAPDFNLALERWLKQRGMRTVHYVSPSVWAWRERRAASIGLSADRVLCLFPMEPPIYARHGVDARFVGHPFADQMPMHPDRSAARARLQLDPDATVLLLLPGSRRSEIARLGADFIAAAARVAGQWPRLQVVIAAADDACHAAITAQIAAQPPIAPPPRVLHGQAREAMVAADVILLASGTAALEALLAKRPLVVGYKLSALTALLVRTFKLLKLPYVSLPNVLAGEKIVPELLQEQCTPQQLADAVLAWLRDPAAVAALVPRFEALHDSLRRDAAASAADAVLALLRDADPVGIPATPGAPA